MITMLGQRQQHLLHCLLRSAQGMTVDDLSQALAISHNAVRQHLVALEGDALIERGPSRPSGGRPEQIYVLSQRGRELFPRQYGLLAELLIESLRAEGGAEEVGRRLRELGATVGHGIRARTPAIDSTAARIEHARAAMSELGYEAELDVPSNGELPGITAHNCVYGQIAAKFPEVCQFDVAMLGAATGAELQQAECLVRGGSSCRFRFRRRS